MMMSVKSRKNRPVTSAQSFQDAKLALNSLNTWAQLTRWFKTQPDSHIFVYFLSHFCLLRRVSFKTKTCFIYLTKTGCRERVYKWSRIMFDDFGGKKAANIQLAALVSKCWSQIKKNPSPLNRTNESASTLIPCSVFPLFSFTLCVLPVCL